MKRIIRFNQGIIGGYEKDSLIGILPQLESSFRQRKQYYEYYFDDMEVELSIEELDKLSNVFTMILDYDELVIKL